MSWEAWEEAQEQISAEAARRREVRRELRAGLVGPLSETPRELRGIDFAEVARHRWPALSSVLVGAPWRDEMARVQSLIVSHELVRAKVGREMRGQDRLARVSRAPEIAAAIAALGDQQAAAKLRTCNDPDQMELGICVHENDEGAPGVVLVKPRRHRCWQRGCPRCQRDIAARLRKRYERRTLWLIEHNKRRAWRLQSFVLTTTWTLDGDDGGRGVVRQLHQAVKKLVKHFWGMKGAGAFGGWEIGSKGGRLHAHGLAFGPYVPHAELSDYWRQLTGCFVVWARSVKPGAEWNAVCEAIKYTAKLSRRDETGAFAMKPEDLAKVHMVLKGRRRVWSWGAFYNLKDAEQEEEAKLKAEDAAPDAEHCEQGHRMVFLPLPMVRALVESAERAHHLKGAIKCPPGAASATGNRAPPGAGPPEGA
jgi:hypothetical protein